MAALSPAAGMGFGELSHYGGAGRCVEYLESFGISVIEERSKHLSRWLRGELLKHPKVVCYDPEHADAIRESWRTVSKG